MHTLSYLVIFTLFPALHYRPGQGVTLPPEAGDSVQTPITVRMPAKTPFFRGSTLERQYLKGYAEGYADAVRGHFICRSLVGDRDSQAWADGWVTGFQMGQAGKKAAAIIDSLQRLP